MEIPSDEGSNPSVPTYVFRRNHGSTAQDRTVFDAKRLDQREVMLSTHICVGSCIPPSPVYSNGFDDDKNSLYNDNSQKHTHVFFGNGEEFFKWIDTNLSKHLANIMYLSRNYEIFVFNTLTLALVTLVIGATAL